MEQLKGLPLGRQILLGAGMLLFIDTFLPWQKISIPLIGSHSWTAWHGFWGVALSLLTIALVAWVGARAFGVELPAAVPDGLATLGAAAVILLFAFIKVISDDFVGWAAYVGLILAAVVAVGAWLTFQASGEALPSFAGRPSGSSSSDAGASPPPPAVESEAHPDGPAGTDPV